MKQDESFRERARLILEAPEAARVPTFARHLALNTTDEILSADGAIEVMRALLEDLASPTARR